jgi:hypothetical protein
MQARSSSASQGLRTYSSACPRFIASSSRSASLYAETMTLTTSGQPSNTFASRSTPLMPGMRSSVRMTLISSRPRIPSASAAWLAVINRKSSPNCIRNSSRFCGSSSTYRIVCCVSPTASAVIAPLYSAFAVNLLEIHP